MSSHIRQALDAQQETDPGPLPEPRVPFTQREGREDQREAAGDVRHDARGDGEVLPGDDGEELRGDEEERSQEVAQEGVSEEETTASDREGLQVRRKDPETRHDLLLQQPHPSLGLHTAQKPLQHNPRADLRSSQLGNTPTRHCRIAREVPSLVGRLVGYRDREGLLQGAAEEEQGAGDDREGEGEIGEAEERVAGVANSIDCGGEEEGR